MSREFESVWPGWKITERIGEGSFGQVYKITREEFGHVYESALKVIEIPHGTAELQSVKNEGMTDEEVTGYFKGIVEEIVKEFELMSQLKGDSNIVSYEDHTVVEKTDSFGWKIYIRMELLTPLFAYIRENPFSVRDVILLGIDICKALEVCQKCNIIHRDIKPENIFVSRLGRYKLGDFGIARQMEKSTSMASKTGTPTYMAPEVYKGEKYNSNVDVYSLGLVLYRFLNNNRMPFLPPAPKPILHSDRQKANLLRMSGKEMEKPCRAEGRLAEIVLKACAYDPKERYESAHEFRRALESVLYTEEEGRLIFPEGDALKEEENEYVLSGGKPSRRRPRKSASAEETLPAKDREMTETSCSDRTVPTGEETEPDRDRTLPSEEEPEAAHVPPVPVPAGKGSPEDPRQEPKKKRFPKAALIPIFLGTAAVIAGIIVMIALLAGNHAEDLPTEQGSQQSAEVTKVTVPDLVNLTAEKAEQTLKKSGLTMKETKRVFSETVPKGHIVSQDRKKGAKVTQGDPVGVVISKGPERVTVPSLAEETREDAEKALQKLGLKADFTEEYSETVPAGSVIRQSVEAKKAVKKGTAVTLTVSLGPEPVYEPVYEAPAYYEEPAYEPQTYQEPAQERPAAPPETRQTRPPNMTST